MQMVQEGAFHIRAENSNAIKFYLCPKYDGGNYDRMLFIAVLHALCPMAAMADREAAWESFNIRTGSGPADFDVTQILYYSSQFTLLIVDVDGSFTKSHYHYVLDGQTEHSLWLQHELSYVDHAPAVPVIPRRQTGRVKRHTGVSVPRRPPWLHFRHDRRGNRGWRGLARDERTKTTTTEIDCRAMRNGDSSAIAPSQ